MKVLRESSVTEEIELKALRWQLKEIELAHHMVSYQRQGCHPAQNDTDAVRLHFGLKGDYNFYYQQLDTNYQLCGSHNNILYSDGLDMKVYNKSDQIETFGIDFKPATFIQIAENGTDALKRLAERVFRKESTILSNHWRTNSYQMLQVIRQIIDAQFAAPLQAIFIWSKSLELLVLQADLYEKDQSRHFIKTRSDKEKLFAARDFLSQQIESPPTIRQLARQVGINEYKLKKGFKELFGTTVFGYLHGERMELAKRYLLDTDKTAREIAFELGFSSPQHFNTAFKKAFQITPKNIRKTP